MLADDKRQLLTSDIRCTIVSNYKNNAVLFDIFYRLNTGSVPLSSQELRQALIRGPYSDFIMESTNKKIPLHTVMNLSEPDNRLRDAEILIRFISFSNREETYRGNLTEFLNDSLRYGNENWENEKENFIRILETFNTATQNLINTFPKGKVGRKISNNQWESQFNRVLFEVEVYYFSKLDQDFISNNSQGFKNAFYSFFLQNDTFLSTIESTTKSLERYYTRFYIFQEFINKLFGVNINSIPTPDPNRD